MGGLGIEGSVAGRIARGDIRLVLTRELTRDTAVDGDRGTVQSTIRGVPSEVMPNETDGLKAPCAVNLSVSSDEDDGDPPVWCPFSSPVAAPCRGVHNLLVILFRLVSSRPHTVAAQTTNSLRLPPPTGLIQLSHSGIVGNNHRCWAHLKTGTGNGAKF